MNWREDLKKFESDNSTGSAELLEQYIELLLYWIDRGGLETPKDKSFLMDQIKRLQDRHKSLFVLLHFTFRVIPLLNASGEDWIRAMAAFLNEYRENWTGVNIRLAMQAGGAIDLHQKLVLCHSQSSAVKEVFDAYKGNRKKVRIIQTESRPILEGRIQAVTLSKLGYEVKLVSDSGFARHLDRINTILLGADAIFREHFVNKSGSYNICLAAKNAGIPVYVLADSRKFWFSLPPEHRETQYTENKKPGAELWKEAPPGLDIENYYFEKVPVNWVDGFITEKEILNPSRLQMLRDA